MTDSISRSRFGFLPLTRSDSMPRVVNDLPSELLAGIFLLRIYEERSRVYYDTYHPTPKWKDWYNFLSVCCHWNCIAMGTPLLWNFVDMGSSFGCIEIMLKRSSDVLLRVQPQPTGAASHFGAKPPYRTPHYFHQGCGGRYSIII